MDSVLVRYSELGTKSRHVRQKMADVLRQRVQDRLEHEGAEYEKVFKTRSRIIVETEEAVEAADKVSELPGVRSASPAVQAAPAIEEIKEAVEQFATGETFGITTNRAGDHSFDSQDINREIGAHVEEFTGSRVDLDNPDTLIEIDVRPETAYLFTERLEGPGGYPVGTQGSYVALISGGIDSPVAAYEMMSRGADIVPVYFYNKPVAAEDHFLRFKAAVNCLKRFHPSKKWYGYKIDMEEVNRELMDIGRGRMVLHRKIMFRVAEKIAEKEGLDGIVTGESLGQKSSQTSSNLEATSSTSKPVLRPLLTSNKHSITDKARDIGTFREAEIDSACSTMAPDTPATSIKARDLNRLEERINLEKQVETALNSVEEISI